MAIALVLAAAGARADVFSPGPLAQGHADLEGLRNCTKCHVAGSQLSNDTCLACHKTTKQSIVEKRGIHGRLHKAELACQKCHPEHQGRDADILWGPKGKKGFDHSKTGYPLMGKHAAVGCAQCHNDKLIVDAAVRAERAKNPKKQTFLGLGTQCAQCHFDEHRGQLSSRCASCHTEAGWKPAPRFNHAKTEFPLLGKHADVKCSDCHAKVTDAKSHADAPMRPYSATFMRMKPVAHAACTDCHKDPHEGRFGADCASCHTVDDWKEVKGASGERAFHEKTRYPLRGAHATVECKSCHGGFKGVPAVFKGLKFARCIDCHVDAHLGELGSPPRPCDSCHSVASFRPAIYEPAAHKLYPLEGGHLAIACSACHARDATLESRAGPIKSFLEKRRRKDGLVLTRFDLTGDMRRCDTCHTDTHRGQFAPRVARAGCTDCHQVASFAQVRFDHDKESSFRLTGAHENTACGGCHVLDLAGVIRYRPLEAECSSCHADPHAAQFKEVITLADRRVRGTSCAKCHTTSEWKRTTFQHWPPFTSYVLDGKHKNVDCAGCHPEVDVGGGVRARQYKGVPTTCAGCHFDVHGGAFRGFTGGLKR
jgi:hypothetical protein